MAVIDVQAGVSTAPASWLLADLAQPRSSLAQSLDLDRRESVLLSVVLVELLRPDPLDIAPISGPPSLASQLWVTGDIRRVPTTRHLEVVRLQAAGTPQLRTPAPIPLKFRLAVDAAHLAGPLNFRQVLLTASLPFRGCLPLVGGSAARATGREWTYLAGNVECTCTLDATRRSATHLRMLSRGLPCAAKSASSQVRYL